MFSYMWNNKPDKIKRKQIYLKMLGLYLNTLTFGHTFCSIVGIRIELHCKRKFKISYKNACFGQK